jgi:hypothetical protein
VLYKPKQEDKHQKLARKQQGQSALVTQQFHKKKFLAIGHRSIQPLLF